jgi:predicted Holliday junction resolvase-like endonuclease
MMGEVLLVPLLFFTVLFIFILLYKNASLKSTIETRARQQHDVWREKELDAVRKHYEETARREAALQLQQWKQENEVIIRREAIEKSRAVILGKVSEHLMPFFPDFGHNPKDARFIGTPVDFVVFDGLDDGEVRRVTFVEVKTGSSALSSRERQIRDVIKQRLVKWEELRLPSHLP